MRGLSTAVGLMLSMKSTGRWSLSVRHGCIVEASRIAKEAGLWGWTLHSEITKHVHTWSGVFIKLVHASGRQLLRAEARPAVDVLKSREGASVNGLAGLRMELHRPVGENVEALSVAIRKRHRKVRTKMYGPITAAFVENLIRGR
jgi:hypothetical protein